MHLLKQYQFLAILFFGYVLLFEYSLFFLAALLLIFFGFSKFKFNKVQLAILYYFPFAFYIMRFVFSLSDQSNVYWRSISNPNYYLGGARFYDLQQTLFSIKCNFDPIELFIFKFSEYTKSCPWSARYGPLLELIPYFGNIWRDTLILSFFIIFSYLMLYKFLYHEFYKKKLIVTILFLSPPANFLIERMNIDILILLISFYVIYNYKRRPIFYSTILILLSLLKLHPIGFLLGLITFAISKKEIKLLKINITALFFFIASYSLAIFIQKQILSTQWRPDDLQLTFGLLSDANYLSKLLSIQIEYIYFVLIILFILIQVKVHKSNYNVYKIVNEKYTLVLHGFGMFLLVNMFYANFAYRLTLIIPLFLIIFNSKNNDKYSFWFLFILLIPLSLNFLTLNFIDRQVVENILSVVGKLSLYGFTTIVIQNIYEDIRKSRNY